MKTLGNEPWVSTRSIRAGDALMVAMLSGFAEKTQADCGFPVLMCPRRILPASRVVHLFCRFRPEDFPWIKL
jgi:hypothetical protein